ncbi:hypothetical protein JXJ21_24905 [candidate division KSB1 bacterium]|nr:hypothetical protein [candidate division KSB1 bacterium]
MPRFTPGYGKWRKTGELKKAIYVYDLNENINGTLYAATACTETNPMGKVFNSDDGGIIRIPCADLPGAMTVYSLVVAGDTLHAGTYPNSDIFKSIDSGDSWINTADLPDVTSARSLVRLRDGD